MDDANVMSEAEEQKQLQAKLEKLSDQVQRLYHVRERLWAMSDRVFSPQASENEVGETKAASTGYLENFDALLHRFDCEITRCESTLGTLEQAL